MRRLIIVLGIIAVIVVLISKGNQEEHRLSMEKYAVIYDENVYRLEKYISEQLYLDNVLFFNNIHFNNNFSNQKFRKSLKGLLNILDDCINNLNELNDRIEDKRMLELHGKFQGDLSAIRNRVKDYRDSKVLSHLYPNIATLYHETYKLMSDISDTLLNLNTNMAALETEIGPYRDYDTRPVFYKKLNGLKTKNRLRILYTYLYTSAYIASYDDYTGLHTNPKIPCYFELNDGVFIVYELNLEILDKVRKFSRAYLNFDEIITEMKDRDITLYCKLLDKVLEGIDNYYEVRSQFEDDFYTSYKFKEYQTKAIDEQSVIIYNFTQNTPQYNFSEMKNTYFQVKFITDKSPLNSLMFDEEKVPTVDSGAGDVIFDDVQHQE